MAWNFQIWELVLLAIFAILFVGGVFWVWLGHGLKSREHGGIVGVIGVIGVILVLVLVAALPAPAANIAPAPSNTGVSTYVYTSAVSGVAPALPSACTNYASSATVTCTVGFNKTQTGFQLALSNTTDLGYTPGGAGTSYASLNYLDVAFHSARTDTVNQSYYFTYTFATLPTWTSLGSSPTTCSIVGFTTATASSPGVWKTMFHSGQNGGIAPTQNAPTVTTQVGADPTVINSFSSINQVAQISFAGGNSTTTSQSCWGALSLYESLTITVSISQSTPPLFTLDLLPIGYNT